MADDATRLAMRLLAGSLLNRFRIVFNDGTDDQEASQATPLPVAIVSGGGGGGGSQDPPPRVLATEITLAAGTASANVTGVLAGSYIFEAIFTGADLQLQRLGPNGLTWINAGTLAASGSVGVVLAAGDTLRLRNNSGGAITALTARIA